MTPLCASLPVPGPEGNVEIGGALLRVRTIIRGDLFIDYLTPVRPAGAPSMLIVRFVGVKVLEVSFDETRMMKTRYVPGAWERLLFA